MGFGGVEGVILCQGCGASITGGECPYCGTRYTTLVSDAPIRNVPFDSRETYNHRATIEVLVVRGALYSMMCRLSMNALAIAINAMFQRQYDAGTSVSDMRLQYQLVIPPALYIHVLAMNEGGVLGRFIEAVWIDGNITVCGADAPWFLFANEDAVLSEQIDYDTMYFSSGTSP